MDKIVHHVPQKYIHTSEGKLKTPPTRLGLAEWQNPYFDHLP